MKLKTTAGQRKKYREFYKEYNDQILEVLDDLDTCLAEIERLREALQFYAEPRGSTTAVRVAMQDNGERARKALEQE